MYVHFENCSTPTISSHCWNVRIFHQFLNVEKFWRTNVLLAHGKSINPRASESTVLARYFLLDPPASSYGSISESFAITGTVFFFFSSNGRRINRTRSALLSRESTPLLDRRRPPNAAQWPEKPSFACVSNSFRGPFTQKLVGSLGSSSTISSSMIIASLSPHALRTRSTRSPLQLLPLIILAYFSPAALYVRPQRRVINHAWHACTGDLIIGQKSTRIRYSASRVHQVNRFIPKKKKKRKKEKTEFPRWKSRSTNISLRACLSAFFIFVSFSVGEGDR